MMMPLHCFHFEPISTSDEDSRRKSDKNEPQRKTLKRVFKQLNQFRSHHMWKRSGGEMRYAGRHLHVVPQDLLGFLSSKHFMIHDSRFCTRASRAELKMLAFS